ncbi:MAG: RNA methyltransferase [bacterium]
MSNLETSRQDIVAIVENVRSLHNVGALFRTADGAGVKEMILCGITGSPPRNEIRKAALGADEAVPWRYEKSALMAIEKFRDKGFWVLALEKTENSQLLYEIDLKTPLALVVGNEFNGISPEVLAAADLVAHLPMRGAKISLNVSVAFGIAVYEINRRLAN